MSQIWKMINGRADIFWRRGAAGWSNDVCVWEAADTSHTCCNIQHWSVDDTFSHCSPAAYWVQNIYILGESEGGGGNVYNQSPEGTF